MNYAQKTFKSEKNYCFQLASRQSHQHSPSQNQKAGKLAGVDSRFYARSSQSARNNNRRRWLCYTRSNDAPPVYFIYTYIYAHRVSRNFNAPTPWWNLYGACEGFYGFSFPSFISSCAARPRRRKFECQSRRVNFVRSFTSLYIPPPPALRLDVLFAFWFGTVVRCLLGFGILVV